MGWGSYDTDVNSDFSNIGVQSALWRSFDERSHALTPPSSGSVSSLFYPVPAVGNYVQYGSFTGLWNTVDSFILESSDFEGFAHAYNYLTDDHLEQSILDIFPFSYPGATTRYLHQTTLLPTITINSTVFFTRYKDRSFGPSTPSGQDDDFNTLADGMKARNTVTGEVYTRVSGSWNFTPFDTADLLSNSFAAPNHATDTFAQEGDYVYSAMFHQYKTLASHLTTTGITIYGIGSGLAGVTFSDPSGGTESGYFANFKTGFGRSSSLATAKALALSDWTAASFTNTYPGWYTGLEDAGTSGSPVFEAEVVGGYITFNLRHHNLNTMSWRTIGDLKRDLKFYTAAVKERQQITSIPITNYTFNSDTTGAIDGAIIHEIASGTGVGNLFSVDLNSADQIAPWGTPGVGTSYWIGFIMIDFETIEKWGPYYEYP